MIDARRRRFARHVPERRTALKENSPPLHLTRRDKRSASLRGELASEFGYVLWIHWWIVKSEMSALRVFAAKAR
jgi:hypothetical protein